MRIALLWMAVVVSGNYMNSAFTSDGRTVYYTRTGKDTGAIVSSAVSRDGQWSTPTVLSFSGTAPDYDPFVSADGAQLFFISKRDRKDYDIFVADRTSSGWSAPRNLGAPINTDGDELYPSVATDGTLYFSSCGRPDSRGRCDLYRARLRDGRYTALENLGDPINTKASETDAYIAPDQSYMILTVYGRPDAIGDGDLYVSRFRDGVWSTPRPFGTDINTTAREYCPIVSPDGKDLYFTRQTNGVGTIHRVPFRL